MNSNSGNDEHLKMFIGPCLRGEGDGSLSAVAYGLGKVKGHVVRIMSELLGVAEPEVS